MTISQIIWSFGLSVVEFVVGLVISVFSIYFSLKVVNKLTKNIDEWKEIKKGNIAVGVFMAFIVLSMAVTMAPAVERISLVPSSISAIKSLIYLISEVLNLIVGLIVGLISIHLSMTLFGELTEELNELKELKKGNIAVAVLLGSVVLAVSFIMSNIVNVVLSTLYLI